MRRKRLGEIVDVMRKDLYTLKATRGALEASTESRVAEFASDLRATETQLQECLEAQNSLRDVVSRLLRSQDAAESRIQKRLRAQLRYWLEKQIRTPDIIIQDELLPEIGTAYTLLELNSKDGSPIMLGGNINLVNLALGDVVDVALVCTDHKGSVAKLFGQILRGPLDDPYFVLEPLVVTSGAKLIFRALQGHSRSFTYTFYRW